MLAAFVSDEAVPMHDALEVPVNGKRDVKLCFAKADINTHKHLAISKALKAVLMALAVLQAVLMDLSVPQAHLMDLSAPQMLVEVQTLL